MKVGCLVIAFNVDLWIYNMLKNGRDWIDTFYIAYPKRPWCYSEEQRLTNENPTTLDRAKLDSLNIDYKIIEGDWKYDEDTRNAIRCIAKADGCDWLVVQDADEFYTEEGWSELTEIMKQNLGRNIAITTKWLNFWKSNEYIIINHDGSSLSSNECAALSLAEDSYFTYSRSVSARLVATRIICFHLGYVLTDKQALLKVSTWAHTKDVRINDWYRYKWKNWKKQTKYLHPGNPPVWNRAVPCKDNLKIPAECEIFTSAYLDINRISKDNEIRMASRCREMWYDVSVLIAFGIKRLRSLLSSQKSRIVKGRKNV